MATYHHFLPLLLGVIERQCIVRVLQGNRTNRIHTHTHTPTHDLFLEIGLCIMGADVSHDQIIPGIMFIRKNWLLELATCVAVQSPMSRRAHLV